MASSRVGERMTACKVLVVVSMLSVSGMRKASVLPVPVGASMTALALLRISSMALRCISLNCSKCRLDKIAFMSIAKLFAGKSTTF